MDKKHFFSGRRFFFGFILLLIGLVMILERSGILSWEVYDFLLSWKMLLIAIGAFVFFNGNRGAGIIVMGIGAFFMIPDVFEDYEQIKRFFWPALLLLVGVSIMFGNRNRKFHKMKQMNFKDNIGNHEINNDFFDELVIFGAKEINMSSKNFQGGRSTAIFGGIEIDLRQSEISPEGCSIDLTTMFGGNTLKVPNDWTILNRVTTIFGGYSDLRVKDPSYQPNPSKTIVLTGVCIFGGTEVRNFNKAH
jgi:predicted membrane protein